MLRIVSRLALAPICILGVINSIHPVEDPFCDDVKRCVCPCRAREGSMEARTHSEVLGRREVEPGRRKRLVSSKAH